MKIFIFLLVALFAALSLTTCETVQAVIQEPVISLHSVQLADININRAHLLCLVQVQNPNGFDLPFPQTDWELFINRNFFAGASVAGRSGQRLGARDTTMVEVLLPIDYLGLFNSFVSLIGSREIGYKAALAVTFTLPVLGNMVWNLEHEGIVPLPQLPRLTMPSMRIESSNITRTEILVTINVENPNPFEIPSPRISYDYQLNRNSFISGQRESEPLAASSITPIVFPITVNYADLFRSFTTLLTAREAASMLILTCDFNIPIFNVEPMRYEIAGTLPILR
jgi:LEA14-like dessication related protein